MHAYIIISREQHTHINTNFSVYVTVLFSACVKIMSDFRCQCKMMVCTLYHNYQRNYRNDVLKPVSAKPKGLDDVWVRRKHFQNIDTMKEILSNVMVSACQHNLDSIPCGSVTIHQKMYGQGKSVLRGQCMHALFVKSIDMNGPSLKYDNITQCQSIWKQPIPPKLFHPATGEWLLVFYNEIILDVFT